MVSNKKRFKEGSSEGLHEVWRTSFEIVWRKQHGLDLLEVALHDEVLNVCASDHEPLSLLKVDAAELCLDDAAVSDHAHEDVEILWGLGDAGGDVELV